MNTPMLCWSTSRSKALVLCRTKESDKPKQQKIVINKIQEEEITYEVPKPKDQPSKPVRSSWVPAEGGVVKFFDLEKDKEHFVAIGEDYKPPPEQRHINYTPSTVDPVTNSIYSEQSSGNPTDTCEG